MSDFSMNEVKNLTKDFHIMLIQAKIKIAATKGETKIIYNPGLTLPSCVINYFTDLNFKVHIHEDNWDDGKHMYSFIWE